MKSLFDFIGRTEATRGARRWSWTIEKRKRLGQPRQALEGLTVKSFFDFMRGWAGLGAGHFPK